MTPPPDASPFADESALALVGATGFAECTVGHGDTAMAMGSGDLPVLATPAMIALMEAAACQALAGHLPSDRTSVGSHVDVRHLAPSALGAHVTASARIVEIRGTRVFFEVSATHGTGADATEIGRGAHVRVVVARDRFAAGR